MSDCRQQLLTSQTLSYCLQYSPSLKIIYFSGYLLWLSHPQTTQWSPPTITPYCLAFVWVNTCFQLSNWRYVILSLIFLLFVLVFVLAFTHFPPVEMVSFMFLSQHRDTQAMFYLLYKITSVFRQKCGFVCTLVIQNENDWEKITLTQWVFFSCLRFFLRWLPTVFTFRKCYRI